MYGKVFKTNILGTLIIVSTDAEVNKMVLKNHGNTFIPAYPKSVKELLGKFSILQINGSTHNRVHGLIGGFLKSPQFKDRITRDIENSVKFNLARWRHSNPPFMFKMKPKRSPSIYLYANHKFLLVRLVNLNQASREIRSSASPTPKPPRLSSASLCQIKRKEAVIGRAANSCKLGKLINLMFRDTTCT